MDNSGDFDTSATKPRKLTQLEFILQGLALFSYVHWRQIKASRDLYSCN